MFLFHACRLSITKMTISTTTWRRLQRLSFIPRRRRAVIAQRPSTYTLDSLHYCLSSVSVVSRPFSIQVLKSVQVLTGLRSCHAHSPAPFQAAATMLLPGEVTATVWLPTCESVWRRLRQTVAVTSPAKSMAAVARKGAPSGRGYWLCKYTF